MGVRRLSRSRLYGVERKGKDVSADISVGEGLRAAVISATQHREGHKIITDIVLDLGSSNASIKAGGVTPNLPCASGDTDAAYICKVTTAVFGVVTKVEATCLEALAHSYATAKYTDSINIVTGSGGDGVHGTADTGGTVAPVLNLTDILTTVGKTSTGTPATGNAFVNKYFYLGAGASAGTKTAGTATISGIPDADTVTDASRLVLYGETGVKHEMIVDKDIAYGTAGVKNKIQLGGTANTYAKNEEGLEKGIETTNSDFAVTANGDGTITIAAKSGTGAEGNNAARTGTPSNSWKVADGGLELTVSDFTGGKTLGLDAANAVDSFTAGKLLLRFEGFAEPADK